MKKLLVCLSLLIVMMVTVLPVMADIPPDADYRVVYEKVGGVPTWSYLPGSAQYGLPTFGSTTYWYWWQVPNLEVPDFYKLVWWEVEFAPGYAPIWPPWTIWLDAPIGYITPLDLVYNPANLSWTASWQISVQPGWERIRWRNYNLYDPWHPELYELYYNQYRWFHELWGVERIHVATTCVPEPGSMLVLGSGLVGLAAMVRRRRW